MNWNINNLKYPDYDDLAKQVVAFVAREHAWLVIVSTVFLVLVHGVIFVEHLFSLDPRIKCCR